MLAVEGLEPSPTPVHHLFDDGSFAITVPANGLLHGIIVASGAAGVQAVLEMTDYAPLPLREPVRSLVWISGRLFDVPPPDVAGLLDLIAAGAPESRSAAGEHRHHDAAAATPPTRWCGSRSTPSSWPTRRARSPSASAACSTPSPTRSARWSRAGCSTSSPPTATSSTGWPTGCRAPLRHGRVRPLGLDRYGVQLRVESRGRRPRRPAAVRQARRRRHRPEPGHPRADGLPVPQRPARAPHLSGPAATVAPVTGPTDELLPDPRQADHPARDRRRPRR